MTGRRRWVAVVPSVAAGLLVATGLASLLLASTWRPSIDGAADGQALARFVDIGGSLAVIAAVAAAVVMARHRADGSGRQAVMLAVLAPVVGFVGQLFAPLARWDQLALRSVTTGTDVRGFFLPAFDDDVRFVLVDDHEVGQAAYRSTVLLATAAPWLAAVCVVAAIVARRRVAPIPAGVGRAPGREPPGLRARSEC